MHSIFPLSRVAPGRSVVPPLAIARRQLRDLRRRTFRGSVLIDAMLTIPILLAVVFFATWFGSTLNAKVSLASALGNGIRLGLTRGDIARAGSALIPDLDNAASSLIPCNDIKGNPARGWLVQNIPDDQIAAVFGGTSSGGGNPPDLIFTMHQPIEGSDPYECITQLPVQYMYTLAYVKEALVMSLGSNIKFPCRRDDTSAGCVRCHFINPITLGDDILRADVLPTDRLGLECLYKPHVFALDKIWRLLSFGAGGSGGDPFIVRQKKLVVMPRS